MSTPRSVAIAAAKEAGAYLARNFDRFDRRTIRAKSKHEIRTALDTGAERIILRHLRRVFPHHSILSEETGRVKRASPYLWVVDPLDGTTNYSFHNPIYATGIALLERGKPILAVTYAPHLGELYVAERGKSATKNGKRIRVSNLPYSKSLLTYCHGNDPHDVRRAIALYRHFKLSHGEMRQLGCAAIEFASVAAGYTEAYISPGAHPWDVAGGVLLVEEAGGKVTDFSGRPWTLRSPDVLASNGKIHAKLLAMIRRVGTHSA